MRRQALLINPPIHRVAGDSEVSNDLLDGEPPFAGRSRLIPGLILHASYILSKSRNQRESALGHRYAQTACVLERG